MAAPEENNNAEKWTIDAASEFMNQSLDLAKEKAHDFIGEVARDMNQYRQLYDYLAEKFPELNDTYKRIVQECETNCFSHGKKGDIVPSLAIMNLKSNHKWTDRTEQNVNQSVEIVWEEQKTYEANDKTN